MSVAAAGEHLNQSADVHISQRHYITRSPYSKGKTRNVFNISFKKKKFLRVLYSENKILALILYRNMYDP
jgi:hypothetical protein